ncbi:DNA polymerase III subunit alpha [Denitrobaculum tricleocarpae]|uniref:DNA polymerase III subunit alpha n=1 Tax=Denitrobaculum tricleocarpae TaxID=2591009 RepID=A0A545TPK5_9PROT|nr:DNA polymerase III subunit alpha [Denitrobaculum tricleocarpae]TQV79118.1 DNA polymerase III subunit alpha [Denitrobaculum tricleocarpae]
MSHSDFVHLRVHSAYSLSEGAVKVKDLIALCQKHEMPAAAITDSSNLFGTLEFAFSAKGAGLQPIIGCQLAISRSDIDVRTAVRPEPDQLPLLVQNEAGYLNLMKLVSKAFLETEPGHTPQIDMESLAAHSEGLLALSGGPAGAVGRLLNAGRNQEAEDELRRLSQIFAGRFYVEIMRHDLPEEHAIEERLIDLAYSLDLPLVATNDVFFADEGMYRAHDALICIAEGAYVSQDERRRLTVQHRFKSAKEMQALFADLPEAIENTLVIARRCSYFPDFVAPILPAYTTEAGRTEAEELRAQSEQGLEERLQTQVFTEDMDDAAREEVGAQYRKRLDYELGVIEQMGFPGYFLIVADFIQWSKGQGIPVGPGRGSGAGSVVAWALTITDLDPLRWGLLFERFLNPERVSMPDFDVDFCQDRRDEVIRYVQDKYGHDRVAQIITFGKLQARAALRDVGRVLQMPYPQVDRISKLVPNNPANPVTLQEAIDGEPQLRDMRRDDETVARLLDTALKIEGLYRHASTHAAGVVIGDRPLDELVPLYRDPRSDMPVTQFNMKFVEQAGLVKFDFLGLKTLTVLQKACEFIHRNGGEIDLETIPLDDKRSFDMLSRGDTVGVFQLESSGMRDVLKRLQPDRFEDIIAVVALYRPGPMDNIPSYIRRKHGQEEPDYLHPTLEGILKETYGIMIYQEQVMQIAQVLSGYSLGGADLLRRAMGKKIKAEMEAQRKIFNEGAVKNEVNAEKADEIFDQVNKFAGYGFNKSHAAAYALVAYQTAYLKANYPVEFMAASMTYDMNNTDKLNVFRQELSRLKIPLLAPDLNRSNADFNVEIMEDGKKAVRYALAAVKNVGGAAMQSVVAEREASGGFQDIADFANRVDCKAVNKRQIENLASAGGFDSILANRQKVYAGADTIMRNAVVAASERESAQVSLFGDGAAAAVNALTLPNVPDWPEMERLKREFDAIGFYLSAHPLDAYKKVLERLRTRTAVELMVQAKRRDSGILRMAGIVIGKQERVSQRGNRFAFVSLSDATGVIEIMLFSEILQASRELLDSGEPLLVTVTADAREGEDPRFMGQAIRLLDEAAAQTDAGLKLYMNHNKPLENLKSILERDAARGKGRVSLVLDLDDGQELEVELPGAYQISPLVRQAIKAIPGLIVEDV